ncbi:MAG: heme-binding protein [Myxococcota bacterium]|nr:heme-binding protein [Myxococcota bacterium]
MKILLGLGLGVIGLWTGYTVAFESRLASPKHQILLSDGAFQIRKYEPFIVAQTQTQHGREELNKGFRILAGYIFGRNQAQEKMAMTAPVMQTVHEKNMDVAFFMGNVQAISDLPEPIRRDVIFDTIDWGQVATLRFSGSGKEDRFVKKEKQLRQWIERKGYQIGGDPIFAQYNSPTAFPPMRRNEVIIPLTPQ